MADEVKKTDSGKKTILVVEDDQFLVRLYQLEIAKKGIDVWIATNGEEALAFMSKGVPNAILLDLMLPGKNGFDVLSEMRSKDTWKNIPVFIVSNLGQEADIKRAEGFGVKDYTVKVNMRLSDVVDKVAKLIQ